VLRSLLPLQPRAMAGARRGRYRARPFPRRTMNALHLLPLLSLAGVLAAQTPPSTTPALPLQPPVAKAQDPAAAAKKLDERTWEHFGDGITESAATPLADVLKKPEDYTGKVVRIEAPITAVCQTKGCWMHLGSQQPPVMVKFKDYGFFVPKDASGRTAIVEGTMAMKQETVEETKHYLEDAGKHDEAAKVTEGRKLYRFMASGVAIKKAAKKLDEKTWEHFGDGIAEGVEITPMDHVVANLDLYTGKRIRLEAPITAVCKVKGCWMHLGDRKPPVMVKFKDYGFFVPKDASGRTAIVDGSIAMKQETVAQTRHYLEDAGKHDEAAKVTEGRKVYLFMASGVAIKKAEK
jgi:hypothetical protein